VQVNDSTAQPTGRPSHGAGPRATARTRVLVVEDEQDIAGLIKHTLERTGEMDVEVVTGGDAALRTVTERPPDLVLLDLNLPVLGGLEVCRILRAKSETAHVPIIILTARTSESDRVAGLDLGADDYITKPFSLRELAARVRAVLRRGRAETAADAPDEAQIYQGTHLRADFDAVSVEVDGAPVKLTRREFELLRYLVDNRNRVLTRDRLLERVWGYDRVIETRSVDVHVGRLRGKLGPAGRQIETVVGLGYRFVE
jgi:DNA-binding response OmpR family regulator